MRACVLLVAAAVLGQVVEVDAVDMAKAFEVNQVAFTDKYGGKRTRVSGKLFAIYDSTLTNGPVVVMETKPRIYFQFEKSERASIASLVAGKVATIEGKCNRIGYGSIEVRLQDCKLITP